jgi:hypothetical protein
MTIVELVVGTVPVDQLAALLQRLFPPEPVQVYNGATTMVPVAFTALQPPVKGIL